MTTMQEERGVDTRIYIPTKLSNKLLIERIKKGHQNKGETIIAILKEYFK